MSSWQAKHLGLFLAIACGAGCTADEPARGVGTEHHAGAAAADRTPEVRTGTIATAAGPVEISYEVIDGVAVVEGDILVPWSDFVDPHVAHAATVTRSATWQAGVVPYVIDPGLPDPQRVHDAIRHWHERTAIRLVPRTTETDFLRFVNGDGCSSWVGRLGTGRQDVTLNAICTTGNAIHEIGHAIGLWHEQSRQDRDDHVTIHWQNIEAGMAHNFEKYSSGMDVGPYDYGSIMHYGSYAFSANNLPTITRRDGTIINAQRTALSSSDLMGVELLYGPPFQIGRTSALDRIGRLHVFAKGTDHAVWYTSESVANGAWGGWISLGGSLRGTPVVARNLDGRLEMFAVGWDNRVYHRWQQANLSWSGWADLGGQLAGLPVVARNLDGRLEVFGRGTDNSIWHIWQVAPNAGWSSWASFGGALQGNPAVGQNLDGRLQVFATGTDGQIWSRTQVAPNATWDVNWTSHGGSAQGSPAVGRDLDGRLELFVNGLDGRLWRCVQPLANGGFGLWVSLGAQILGSPAVGRNLDGRLEVAAVGTDTSLGHLWQLSPGGDFSGWTTYGGTTVTRLPDVTRRQDGRMEAFAVGVNDRVLYHQPQAVANGWWSGWAPFNGITVVPD